MPGLELRPAALAAFGLLAAVGTAAGEPELGSPTVTRLWRATNSGPTPACTGAYVTDPWAGPRSATTWLVTVRHCAEGGPWHAGRDGPGAALTIVDGPSARDVAGADLVRLDSIAVGRRSRPMGVRALSLAERMPRAGSVWIHGFPFGVEHITAARILGDSVVRPGSVEMRVVTGPQTEAGPGFSGAPVIDADNRLIGLLWALRADGERELTAFVVPVEALRAALARLTSR